jgi:hypothetical protein
MNMKLNKSHPMTVDADLDGRTVAEIREMLSEFPDNAVLETYTNTFRGSDESLEEFEFFHIVW